MIEQTVFNGLLAGAGYALFAVGFGLIFQVGRFFHIAHAGIYVSGAYLAYVLIEVLGLNIWLGVPLAVLETSALGALIYSTVFQPLRAKRASSLVLLIASLGLFVILQNLISIAFGDSTKQLRGKVLLESVNLGNAYITPIQICIVITSTITATLLWVWLTKTNWGRLVRAMANDPDLCESVGVDSNRVMLLCFGIGSGIAAMGAILSGFDTDLNPLMGFRVMLFGVTAVIVGGIGSIKGAFFGGLLVGLTQHLGVLRLPAQWQDAVVFALLVFFLLFRPNGLFGKQMLKTCS